MKKAFITTVFNEEKTIFSLLESLRDQTVRPYEIIIVDAFSRDKTVGIIKDFQKRFPKLNIKVYKKKGNRSVGRNFGISNAKSEIIAISDAGCTLKKDWFYEITKPFEKKNIDVVAGFYKPVTNSIFEKCLATYTCVMEDKVTPNFLPSSRSVAFKKNIWEKEKGYPEELDTCEDLVFAKKLKSRGYKFFVRKKAIVYWPQRKNLLLAFMQFFSYAKGDGEALYIRRQTPLLYGRYFVGAVLLIATLQTKSFLLCIIFVLLIFFYFLWSIFKNYKYVRKIPALLLLPLLQITSDVAVLLGTTIGIFKKTTM